MQFHALRRIARSVIAWALAVPVLLLTACGGGGGSGELDVSFDYPYVQTTVLASNNVAPSIQGLEGHSPSCSVTGGSLPKGMSIDGGSCALTGEPLEAGGFSATVTLRASGASGSVTSSLTVNVQRAAIVYPSLTDGNVWGVAQSLMPTIHGYTAQARDSVSYAWAQDQSQDPDNMRSYFTLDPATGHVTGAFAGGPNHTLSAGAPSVVATIVRNGASVTATGYFDVQFYTPVVYYPFPINVQPGTSATIPASAPPFSALGFNVTYSLGNTGGIASIDPSTGAVTINTPTTNAPETSSIDVNWTASKGSQVFHGDANLLVFW